MDFDVVRRDEVIIAGAVLRSPALLLEEGNRAKVLSAWEHNLSRVLPGTPATAYVDYEPDLNSYHTHIVGYRCRDLSQVEFGDVAALVPGGRFARFECSDDNIAVAIETVWRMAWDAEAEGAIVRSYSGDFERYPDTRTVAVYVALRDESGDDEAGDRES
ncbi:MAG TPA: effector binding domain-containing protein [Aldersonia sp.]